MPGTAIGDGRVETLMTSPVRALTSHTQSVLRARPDARGEGPVKEMGQRRVTADCRPATRRLCHGLPLTRGHMSAAAPLPSSLRILCHICATFVNADGM